MQRTQQSQRSQTVSVVVILRSHLICWEINACYLAMDLQFVSMKTVRKVNVVTVNFNISGFHGNALLGCAAFNVH